MREKVRSDIEMYILVAKSRKLFRSVDQTNSENKWITLLLQFFMETLTVFFSFAFAIHISLYF